MARGLLNGVAGLAALGAITWHAMETPQPRQNAPVVAGATTDAPPQRPAPGPAPDAPEIAMPVIEQQFITLIRQYADMYRAGANDLIKGRGRPERAKAICQLFRSTNQHHVPWVGKVAEMSSTSKGEGVLSIKIADGITVSTTNNDFSQAFGDHTLLIPGTEVYEQATTLHVGQTVLFNGMFHRSEDDCFLEKSLTQEGSMTEPDWAITFEKLRGAQ